jgi:hypothetical protein
LLTDHGYWMVARPGAHSPALAAVLEWIAEEAALSAAAIERSFG